MLVGKEMKRIVHSLAVFVACDSTILMANETVPLLPLSYKCEKPATNEEIPFMPVLLRERKAIHSP